MDLALNNPQTLICDKTQQTKPNQTILHIYILILDGIIGVGSLRDVMVVVLNSDLKVSKFEPQLRYYVHFRTNTLWKYMELLIHLRSGLNIITAVLLQGWIWH